MKEITQTKKKVWEDFTPKSADKIFQVLSYGGGKQTFAMLVLIKLGRLPKPDLVIFADTQNEHEETYQHIKEHAIPLCKELGIPFEIISKGSLMDDCWDRHQNPMPPICTLDYKVRPINKYLFQKYGLKRGIHQIDVWIGITTDEESRAVNNSLVAYARKVFPLIDMGLSRDECIQITIEAGYPVPRKSGCRKCPHQNWEKLFFENPKEFEYALAHEKHTAIERPNSSLPQFGRSLRTIKLNPNFKKNSFVDATCVSGICMV